MVIKPEKRQLILECALKKMKWEEIVKLLNVSRSSVARIVRAHKSKVPLPPKKQMGRPHIFSQRDERAIVREKKLHPFLSPPHLALFLSRSLKRRISVNTVRRVLYRAGLHGRRAARKPYLKPSQRKARLEFAKKCVEFSESFWDQVIFSDESSFKVYPNYHGEWVWRKVRERMDPAHLAPTAKFGGGGFQVWGCLTSQGVGFLCSLKEGLDAETYLTILKEELQDTMKYYLCPPNSWIFQQDGASVHTAKVVRSWFAQQKIELLPWPAQSPDLNPIENLWGEVKRRIQDNHPEIDSKETLWEALQTEWEATPKELCHNLVHTMKDRLEAVILAKGGSTKY